MTEIASDPTVLALRVKISENDRAIVSAVNERLRLVSQLQDHKSARSYDRVDPDREEWLVSHLEQTNRGPLSNDGVKELCGALLRLTKRELSFASESARQSGLSRP